jgi:hypothetical protein
MYPERDDIKFVPPRFTWQDSSFQIASGLPKQRKILMRCDIARPLIIAFALLIAVSGAQAQTAPPLKPGLWQVHIEREVNGQKVPDPSERLKNMSPEKRAQVEAMMKQHGMGSDAAGERQVCYTRETLAKDPWTNSQTDCKATFSSRSSSAWKWHTSCPKSGLEADGEAIFTNPENYVVTSTTVSKIGDTERNSRTTFTAKWKGSDCGDVKPLDTTP